MRFLLLCLAGVSMILNGCNVQTGVAPVETVIPKSADRDFGFTGTWIPTPNPKLDVDLDVYEMTIKRDDSYTATLTDSSVEDALTVEFRTHEMSKDQPHAIIELECKALGYQRLAVAAVKDDHLYLWTLDGRKIGEHLFNDGITAVIEHFTFSSTVRCDPEKLLNSIAKHSTEMVGDAQVFERKAKISR